MTTNAKVWGFAKRAMSLAVALLVAFGVFAAALPAQAANTPAQGGEFKFDKYLVMDQNANVPNVTFNFTIAAGSYVAASGGEPEILAGIGTPTVGSAEFEAPNGGDTGTTTYDTVQEGDTLTLGSGKKYAAVPVTVDFSDISFTAPGIYRYIITETASSQDGITNDTESTRTLDVYVRYKKTGGDESSPVYSETDLEATNYVLHDGTEHPGTAAKSTGFTNQYTTYDLTLEKQVTGNQGDREKYFEFTVNITGAVAGTKYTVVTDGNTYTPANPTVLVAEDGSVSGTFYLKDDEKIVIQGLTSQTNYTITETSCEDEGYTTSYVLDSAVESVKSNETTKAAMGDADHTVVFTNHRQGTVPTGVLLETAPYIALTLAVVAGFVVLFATGKRRRHR